ncbi:MAG: tetratricopeptide repeat protein [Prolixibacteraceae bacterium]
MIPNIHNKIIERLEYEGFNEVDLNGIQAFAGDDPLLAEEISLFMDIDKALNEEDIMSLRNQLKNITNHTTDASATGHSNEAEAYFGLSEEVVQPVNLNVDEFEPEIGNYLQKLHIKNHALASKEVVHDLYSEKEVNHENDCQKMSLEDELLFDEIQDAISEKEIIDLRANLQSIGESVSVYEHTFEQIEDFVDGELDDELEKLIREEAMMNASLSNEIDLHSEINSAIEEMDIMKLRNGLKQMMKNENSHSRSVEEIDSYLTDEMDELSLAHFEEELISNSGLLAELNFHKDLDKAVGEADIMALRAKLKNIASDENDRGSEKLGVGSPKLKKLVWYAVASSIVMVLAFSSLIKHKTYPSKQLYTSYYQPYKNGANVSRSASSSVNAMNSALYEIDKGNYPSALKILQNASSVKQDGFSVSFYSGIAYQGLGDYTNAIRSFNEVVQHGDNLLVEQSEWYIGLCYLRIEEREKAIKQFKSIVSENGFYREQSSKLLKQLE